MRGDAGRLLLLCHRLPYPPHNGAAIRSFNVLRELAHDWNIDLLCFDRFDPVYATLSLEERVGPLRGWVGDVAVFSIPQERSWGRFLVDHARSLLTRRAYTWYVHRSSPYSATLRRWLRQRQYALVHLDSMDLVSLLPELPLRRVVCTHHNVESQLLRRRASREGGLKGRYMSMQASLLEREERRWLPQVALNIAVSKEDELVFRNVAPGSHVAVVPNGVDCEYFAPDVGPRRGCVFVGGTTWFPNRDALEWTVEAILPEFRRHGIAEPVVWIGRISDEERARYADVPGLELTGYLDDIRPIAARAKCFIAPMRVGGGTRLKMLDAWAMGLPVVATELAAEGLGASDGHDMLIRDEPASFAAAVRRVLDDPELAARLGTAGRKVAVARFSWARVGAEMRELYRAVASGAAPSPME